MRNLKIISILFYAFTCPGCFVNENVNKKLNDVFITFASGYKVDTVSLKVNNFAILQNEILSTKEDNNDITTSYLRVFRDSVYYFADGVLKSSFHLSTSYSNKIIIEPTINNRPYSFTMYFKKGEYLLISKHLHYFNVYFNQYNKKPELY